nr:helix-turn-helix domain-containing protein [Streptomyces boncukensis]
MYIEEHLADPALSPAVLAEAHHISVRQLHRVFQQQGATVASWIRARRLERCCQDLADPAQAHVPVHAVAARWGYRRAPEFTRAFRAVYDMPPNTWRRRALRAAGTVREADAGRPR